MEIFQNSLRCNFCQKVFDKRNILKRHLREKHYCGNVYKCNMCTVSFVRKERLIRHLKSVHFDIKYTCEECDMKFVEKYKHNYHLVHSHGYAYCASCKIAYKIPRPMDLRGTLNDAQRRAEISETEHICAKYAQFFRCFICSCKGKKVYNRLNFFIRHLQLEHKICEFQKIKEIIDQNTFETRNSRGKSRIRAKTLEGLQEEPIAEDLKDMFNYVKTNFNECDRSGVSSPNWEKWAEPGSSTPRQPPKGGLDCSRELSAVPCEEERTVTDFKGDFSLKELMQNINIMCMMENNYKKYLVSADCPSLHASPNRAKEEDLSPNFDSKDIVLGKRGRPSKMSLITPHSFAEAMRGTYLTQVEDPDRVYIRKNAPPKKQSIFPQREMRESRFREKKKIKPVYFDDILMETLNITEKVGKCFPIFFVKRTDIFLELNGVLESREGLGVFVEVRRANIIFEKVDAQTAAAFEQLKAQRRRRPTFLRSYPRTSVEGAENDCYTCSKCYKEFYSFLGFLQHRFTIHSSSSAPP